jgi:hypothetical protein
MAGNAAGVSASRPLLEGALLNEHRFKPNRLHKESHLNGAKIRGNFGNPCHEVAVDLSPAVAGIHPWVSSKMATLAEVGA